MFKGNISSNDTGALPERVFTLCKLVEKKARSENELREEMEPKCLRQDGKNTSYFQNYKTAAEEMGLISISDKVISLAVDSSVVKSTDYMRRYINNHLYSFFDGNFYVITKAYFDLGKEVLKREKNITNLGPYFSSVTGKEIDAFNIRAWRFWASFLGFGYLQESFFIPNANVFLWDIISDVNFEKGKMYSINDFIDMLSPMVNIILGEKINRTLNYGTSSGIRILQDLKKIKIDAILDQKDTWKLDPLEQYSQENVISHITIL